MNKRDRCTTMKVVPRFVYNPDKTERGLKAMADILAFTMRKSHPSSRKLNAEMPE